MYVSFIFPMLNILLYNILCYIIRKFEKKGKQRRMSIKRDAKAFKSKEKNRLEILK